MNPILFIVSIMWIAAGTALIIYTDGTRAIWERMLGRFNRRWMAVLPAVLGIILVVSSFSYAGTFWLAIILGLLALLKAAFILFGPTRQVEALLDWWLHKASEGTLRLYGLLVFILGCVFLSYIL